MIGITSGLRELHKNDFDSLMVINQHLGPEMSCSFGVLYKSRDQNAFTLSLSDRFDSDHRNWNFQIWFIAARRG